MAPYCRLFICLFLLNFLGARGSTADQEPNLTGEEKDLLHRGNHERSRAEQRPLRADAKLCQAARDNARNMARHQKLDHDLDGQTPADRITKAGYQARAWGENISWGQKDSAGALATWMNSPPHKANLLNPEFTEIGVGIATDTQGRKYYVQVFAAPARP